MIYSFLHQLSGVDAQSVGVSTLHIPSKPAFDYFFFCSSFKFIHHVPERLLENGLWA